MHFLAATKITHSFAWQEIRSDELKDIARVFDFNIARILALGGLPSKLVGFSVIIQTHEMLARAKLGIALDDPRCQYGDPNFEILTYLSKEAERKLQMEQWMKSKGDSLEETGRTIGDANLEMLLSASGSTEKAAFASLLSGMAMAAWTAFESMSSDLWVQAVNVGPKAWSKKVFEKAKTPHLKPESERNKEQEKSIPLTVLSEYGYDLRMKMGTLLKQQEKVDFQSLANTNAAYCAIFPEKAKKIFDDNTHLAALEAIRNLYAHRAGMVDEKFKRRISPFPDFAGAEVGQTIVITGSAVSLLIDSALAGGAALLKLMDDELQSIYESRWSFEI